MTMRRGGRARSRDHAPYGTPLPEGERQLVAAHERPLRWEGLLDIYRKYVLESNRHPKTKAHQVYGLLTDRGLSHPEVAGQIERLEEKTRAEAKTRGGRGRIRTREESFFRQMGEYIERINHRG